MAVASRKQKPKRTTASKSAARKSGNGVQQQQPNSSSNDDGVVRILQAALAAMFGLGFSCLVAAPFWMLTHSLSIIYGRPPRLVRVAQCVRYLKFVLWETTTNASTTQKIYLSKTILSHTIMSRVYSFMWILDEILYGRQFSNLSEDQQESLDHPLFVVSAFRSASTQMARDLVAETHYNDASPCFVAPNAMMCAFPYLWLWKLVTAIVGETIPDDEDDNDESGGGITKKMVRERFNSGFTPDSLARHSNDPFLMDTFDGSFLSCHLNGMAWQFCGILPSDTIAQEFNYAHQRDDDLLNQQIWQTDMVNHIDRLARKTLVFYGRQQPTKQRRFLLKGHFLSICPQLQERYKHPKFLTILRDPCDRLRSGINYTAVNPSIFGHDRQQQIPWEALVEVLEETEAQYCQRELEWFGTNDSEEGGEELKQQKLAVAFESFVSNKNQTMVKIVDWLRLNNSEQEVVIGTTATKKSTTTKKQARKKAPAAPRYQIDRSLSELGVNEKAYRQRLEEFLVWMKRVKKETETKKKKNKSV